MKKILILLITLLIITVLVAEEKDYKLGLGFGGGMISGSGFSFRKLSDKGGFQINFGAIMQNNKDCEGCFDDVGWYSFEDTTKTFTETNYDGFGNVNLGVNLYKTLHNGKRSKLYLLGGVAGYLNFEKSYTQEFEYNENSQTWEKIGDIKKNNENDYRLNLGFGFGFDYKISTNISVNLEWPLVFSLTGKEVDIFMYIPQAGIHYYFK